MPIPNNPIAQILVALIWLVTLPVALAVWVLCMGAFGQEPKWLKFWM